MTKLKFLLALEKKLSGLPQEDIEERLTFYSEIIEDRVEEGVPEEEAVAQIGSVEEIAAQILGEHPASKPQKEKKSKRRFKTWEITLLVIGSPVWVSLLIAALAVGCSLYVALWAVVISLWACFASIIACAAAMPIVGVYFILMGYAPSGYAMIAACFVCAGLAIFWFCGCKLATKGTILLGKKAALVLKRCFTKRGEAQ